MFLFSFCFVTCYVLWCDRWSKKIKQKNRNRKSSLRKIRRHFWLLFHSLCAWQLIVRQYARALTQNFIHKILSASFKCKKKSLSIFCVGASDTWARKLRLFSNYFNSMTQESVSNSCWTFFIHDSHTANQRVFDIQIESIDDAKKKNASQSL